MIKIAYLILAHTDPQHIARLANKISQTANVDVYIHIDKKTNILPFQELLSENQSVFFVKNRYDVYWASFTQIRASLSLIEEAVENKQYDRYIMLQGLDYPIASNAEIIHFFDEHREIEFIRACKITGSKDRYFANRCERYWFYTRPNLLKKIITKVNVMLPIKLRPGYIMEDKRYDIYWGSAQWALTGDCIKFILEFTQTHPKFNKYFKYVFVPTETYFQSIVHDSEFTQNTQAKGTEPEKRGLVNWRNLHYFEYGKFIKVFSEEDFETLIQSGCLFFRKATTEISGSLLDRIDDLHKSYD